MLKGYVLFSIHSLNEHDSRMVKTLAQKRYFHRLNVTKKSSSLENKLYPSNNIVIIFCIAECLVLKSYI